MYYVYIGIALLVGILAIASVIAAIMSVAFVALPVIRRVINGKPFSKKRARKIALWNSIFLSFYIFLFSILPYSKCFDLSVGIVGICFSIPVFFFNYFLLSKEKIKKFLIVCVSSFLTVSIVLCCATVAILASAKPIFALEKYAEISIGHVQSTEIKKNGIEHTAILVTDELGFTYTVYSQADIFVIIDASESPAKISTDCSTRPRPVGSGYNTRTNEL